MNVLVVGGTLPNKGVELYDDGTGTLTRRKKKSFDWYKQFSLATEKHYDF